jgi:hypothetical protein
MRRIAVNRWIAPLVCVLLLFEISLLGDDRFEALCVEVRCSTEFQSARIRILAAGEEGSIIRFLNQTIYLSQCHLCALVCPLFETRAGSQATIDSTALTGVKHDALSVKFIQKHSFVPHNHRIILHIMVDLVLENII